MDLRVGEGFRNDSTLWRAPGAGTGREFKATLFIEQLSRVSGPPVRALLRHRRPLPPAAAECRTASGQPHLQGIFCCLWCRRRDTCQGFGTPGRSRSTSAQAASRLVGSLRAAETNAASSRSAANCSASRSNDLPRSAPTNSPSEKITASKEARVKILGFGGSGLGPFPDQATGGVGVAVEMVLTPPGGRPSGE